MGFTGGGAGQRLTADSCSFRLKPLKSAKSARAQVIDRLRPKLASVPGATLSLQAVQDLRSVGGRRQRPQFQYTIQSDNVAGPGPMGPRAAPDR